MQRLLLAATAAALVAGVQPARTQGKGDWHFQRIATFANYHNLSDPSETTVSEIVAASADGKTLIYTDAGRGAIGFIDIANPAHPAPGGTVDLDPDPTDDVIYSPTSVDVLRNQYVLVSVDTSESKVNPSGVLIVLDLATRAVVASIDLGGQPDSVKISPDGRFVAIAIENERDESIPLPQSPGGYLAVIATAGPPATWMRHDVSLSGLAAIFPDDPEPEFVDINKKNQAVVTLQENNHVVVVDLRRLQVVSHFPAGEVSLTQIDRTRAPSGTPATISLTESATGVRREPDAVAWVGGRVATANEGDLVGGSRGFSIFNLDGTVAFDSGNTFEHLGARIGHYPDLRSNSKGTEPEAIAAAKFGPNDLLIVGSERGSFLALYDVDEDGQAALKQTLPGPLAPEGLLVIPHRGLLIASGENDSAPTGVRSTVMIYQIKPGAAAYPHIYSANGPSGTPIPWSALSGMTEIPGHFDRVQAVWDSFYTPTQVFTIDITQTPAVITSVSSIARPAMSAFYDPEGLAYAPDGSLWIASEGNANDSRPNRLIKVDPATGAVLQEVGLPAAVLACRADERAKAASSTPPPPNGTGTFGSGFEGLDIQPTAGGDYLIFAAQQRGWNYTTSPACDALDDDPSDTDAIEPAWTRIWVYDPAAGAWSHVPYQLASKPADADWVGLSEITMTPSGWIVIERDNKTGDFGVLKTLALIPLSPGADGTFTNDEKAVYDLRPALTSTNGWITDKPEGVAVLDDGTLFVVTDNDGVDGWSGETWFFGLGWYWHLFN